MKKRLLPIILVCCMLAAWLAVYAQADDVVAKGECGANGSSVQWTLDSKGNLSITGTGAIRDYGRSLLWSEWEHSRSTAPWYGDHDGMNRSLNLITSLTISNGITCIGTNAFLGLENLAKVTLPDSLVQIKEAAFQRCTSLTKITFPNGIASIEAHVFNNCSNLLNFTMPDRVTSIGEGAFYKCNRLTSVVLPKSVEYVSASAFQSCEKLKNVTILGEIPVVKTRTFQNCPALTEITIPDSVLIMEENAFSGCSALKDVYFNGSESMWKEISVDGGNTVLDSANIHFDTSVEATYRINALSVSDMDGKTLTAIPTGSFLATVSITNRASGATPIILLASYTESGQYQGLMYATVEEPTGATVKITLPVDNSGGKIAQLKAFAVNSFADMTMIGNPVSFPA